MKNKRLIIIVFTSLIILLLPLIAMQFTDEITWTLLDFVIAEILLLGTGLICEIAIRKIKKRRYRIAVCVALIVVILLIWAELAFGILELTFRILNQINYDKTENILDFSNHNGFES
jgi:bacteriorhodopsin